MSNKLRATRNQPKPPPNCRSKGQRRTPPPPTPFPVIDGQPVFADATAHVIYDAVTIRDYDWNVTCLALPNHTWQYLHPYNPTTEPFYLEVTIVYDSQTGLWHAGLQLVDYNVAPYQATWFPQGPIVGPWEILSTPASISNLPEVAHLAALV